MSTGTVSFCAMTDGDDRFVSADEPLAGLQLRCGGLPNGVVAIPSLLEVINKARRFGLRLARPIVAQDGVEAISAWAEIEPLPEPESGCQLTLTNWRTTALPPEDLSDLAGRRAEIDRQLAELTAHLDANQCLLAVEADADDLKELGASMRNGVGCPWTDFVAIDGGNQSKPMHWRLLDGATVQAPGSARKWRASLIPQEVPGREPLGFELCLTADTPLGRASSAREIEEAPAVHSRRHDLINNDVAPVLRQPISQIISNAEVIRTRLAGPLAEEYSNYAGDIAAAGQHLLALIDDLADLEVVESADFTTAHDSMDLAEAARRAASILNVQARDRGVLIDAPRVGEMLPAIADYRRVLQVLLNVLGNAIRYSPSDSCIWVRLEDGDGRARLIIADQGPGMDVEQQQKAFNKFERLGRSGDGGTGLGLYISRRLARVMGGDLTVESAPGQGARFILDLPAAP